MCNISNNSQARNSHQKREIKRKLISKSGTICKICGKRFSIDKLTIDHIIPLATGGTWDMGNLQLACNPCNQEKADNYVDPWSLI